MGGEACHQSWTPGIAASPSQVAQHVLFRGARGRALFRAHRQCACKYVQVLSYLYSSTGYQDELAYAAAMLYKVTGACCCTYVCGKEPAWLLQWCQPGVPVRRGVVLCKVTGALTHRETWGWGGTGYLEGTCLAGCELKQGLRVAAQRSTNRPHHDAALTFSPLQLANASPTPPMPAGEEKYKSDAAKYFKAIPETPLTQEVGELKPLTAVLMAQVSGVLSRVGSCRGWVRCVHTALAPDIRSDARWRVLYTSTLFDCPSAQISPALEARPRQTSVKQRPPRQSQAPGNRPADWYYLLHFTPLRSWTPTLPSTAQPPRPSSTRYCAGRGCRQLPACSSARAGSPCAALKGAQLPL